jgi:hypothetical protein
MYADRWRQVISEDAWLKPRANWDPDLVWVLRSFLANQQKWDNAQSNPNGNKWFAYWSPRFYVVQNKEIVATDSGVEGWVGTIHPLLKKLTGV